MYRCFKSCSFPVGNSDGTNRYALSPDGFPISVNQWHLKCKHFECGKFLYGGRLSFKIFLLSGSTRRNGVCRTLSTQSGLKDNKSEGKSFMLSVQPAVEILSGALL